jgi:small subunit ribosomal protein S20
MLNLSSIKKELAMPNIKSAKKRVLVSDRKKEENRYVKSTMATMIKNFRVVVGQDVKKAEAMLVDITSYIDSAKSKGVIHANTASRKIARLNLLLNKAKATSEVKEQPIETEEKPKKTRAKKVEK